MPVGMFRSEEGWVQVDYGTGGSNPITRSKYEENGLPICHWKQPIA